MSRIQSDPPITDKAQPIPQEKEILFILHRSSLILSTVMVGGWLLAVAAGCNQSAKDSPTGSAPGGAQPSLSVTVVKPERATLSRTVRQPGQIQAFEQTPVYSKLAGYVRKWYVDIGDRVKKGDLLAELSVPEMEVEVKQKQALVQQATAQIEQARAAVLAAQAQLERSKSQYDRLERAGKNGVLDRDSVEETRLGYEASKASLEKAKADLKVADASLLVAQENWSHAKTLLEYAKFTAPYDGIVTRRNVNTGDFVQPATGMKSEPLYVVGRRDIVRVFVEVPEADAGWVNKGAKAHIRVQVLKGQDFTAAVARTSYALDRTARTLIAEIDLPNPKDQLRPGMYASAAITAEHPDVVTLPASAVMTQGDVTQGYQSYCFLVEDGKVRRAPVEIGARGTDRVELLRMQARPAKPGEQGVSEAVTGQEAVVADNLSALSDGRAVSVAPNR
jgi:RND family efflux transporter MFP subunit